MNHLSQGIPVASRQNARTAVLLCLFLAVLVLVTASASFLFPGIYQNAIDKGVLAKSLMPGTVAQDAVCIPAAILTIFLSSLYLKRPSLKMLIALMGLAANFLYCYGLLAIQGCFTILYPFYLVIFTLGLYCLIVGLSSLSTQSAEGMELPAGLRRAIGVFLLVIVVLFVSLWSVMVVSYAMSNTRPDVYGVFVFDLCLVMPALAIIAILLLRNRNFGIALAGVALIKAFVLILSVTIAEATAPLYGTAANGPMIAIYAIIVIISLTLGSLYLKHLKHGT